MTEKRFFKKEYSYDWWFVFDKKQEYCEDMKIPFYDVDNLIAMSEEQVVDLLNEQHEEIQSVKKHINELYEMVKFDVDNGIEVYPKTLMEYILNILKILGDEFND